MGEDLTRRIRAMLEGEISLPEDWPACEALAAGLSAAERGRLLPLLWRREADPEAPGGRAAALLASCVDGLRQPVRISPETFDEGVAALLWRRDRPGLPLPAHSQLSPDEARDTRVRHCLWRLLSGLDGAPSEVGRDGLCSLLPLFSVRGSDKPARVIVAARLAGDDAAAQRATDLLLGPVEGELEAREWGLVLALPPLDLRDWVVGEDGTGHDIEPADRHDAQMRFLDRLPGYAGFACEVFATAQARLEAVAGRQTAYRTDGAFPLGDCAVIGRAALWGLWRNEAWCLDVLGRLWEMAAVAPDPKVKTMPSQSLAIRFANASVTEPRPEALRALDGVAAVCRHAGVAKKLARARRAARTALVAHPERLLALDPAQPLAKDMVKPFAGAVEALLARPEPIAADDWRLRLGPGRKEGWALAGSLVWEITSADGARVVTALPEEDGGWRGVDGSRQPFSQTDAVRLWHPAETPAELARLWRRLLEREGVRQPFLQAGREIYRPAAAERAGAHSALFAGRRVAGKPLGGLARVSGWRAGYDSELHLDLGGSRFCFDAGARVYPGADGEGVTGTVRLTGPQKRLDQVPARVLSEAFRKVDLLVSVGERGAR